MPVRLPRVEAIFGAPIDQLTIEQIQAAVDAGVEEDRDLDFKGDHYEDAEELAKDVAAFANHVGGLLVIGVREQQLRGVEVTRVSLADDPARRYEQILARRIAPFVRDVDILVRRSADDPDEGIVLIAVPRSLLAPHALLREHDDKRRMWWPVRSGTGTRYLEETELAEFYRTRFAGAAAQSARLDRVQAEGRRRLAVTDEKPVWLTISLVPALPGSIRSTDRVERAIDLSHQWAARQPWQEQHIPRRLTEERSVTVGVRRAILPGGRNWQADRLHVELHDDGAGYGAAPCGGYDATTHSTIGVPLRQLALDTLWLTSLLVEHALDAGAAGEALLAAEIFAHPNRVVQILDDAGFGDAKRMSGTFELNSVLLPDSTRPAVSSLSVDLSALAPGVRPRARVAAQLAGDLAAVFGVTDLDVLTGDGQLRVGSVGPGSGWKMLEWAEHNDVLAPPFTP